MKGYLIDTDICVAFFRKVRQVAEPIEGLEFGDLHISEITLAELTYGAYRSARPEYHLGLIADFSSGVNVIPISPSLDLFAAEKARMQLEGRPVDNFDLLIGTTAVFHELTLVTGNIRHFERLQGIKLEDWTA
ncbi:MAG: PIN domain-containing protein [Flavobacteriia bacterium]|nr:PIN domain-containing protein [Flavobacteriia bacterium]